MRCPILLGRDSWMRFHSRSYQTLPPTPDGRVLGELTLAHICDNNPSGAFSYIRNCDALDVAYHLIYEGKGVSLDTIPQLTPVNLVRLDGSPALTGQYMVDLFPLSDSGEATECFFSSGRQHIPLSGCPELQPGDILGTASLPLLRVPLESLVIGDPLYDVLTVTTKLDTAPTTTMRITPTPPTNHPRSHQSARLSPTRSISSLMGYCSPTHPTHRLRVGRHGLGPRRYRRPFVDFH